MVEKPEVMCGGLTDQKVPAHAAAISLFQCCDSRKDNCEYHLSVQKKELGISLSLCLFRID